MNSQNNPNSDKIAPEDIISTNTGETFNETFSEKEKIVSPAEKAKIDTKATIVYETMVDRIKILEKKFETDKTSLLMVFGIFASIVTFLSIEIQILKNICDFYRLLWFSLYILWALLSFIFVLQYIIKSWIENDKTTSWKDFIKNPSIIITLFVVFLLLGFWYYNMSLSNESENQCRNDKYQEQMQTINWNIEDLSWAVQKICNMETDRNKKLSQEIENLHNQFNVLTNK